MFRVHLFAVSLVVAVAVTAPAPPTDGTAPDTGLPLVLVLAGVAVPLGLAFLVGRPILGYARHRHDATRVA